MTGHKSLQTHYDKNLEGLRGLCALMVAFAHFIGFNFFGALNSYYPYLSRIQFAHESVLLFFIISGYVMGLSHVKTPFTSAGTSIYLKKRAVRLYPIYLLALLMTIAIEYQPVPVEQIVGHIFFLQEIVVKPMPANPVMWSLSYECIYYILFIGIWAMMRYFPDYQLLALAVLGSCCIILPAPPIVKSVLVGWTFWIGGLFISMLSPDDRRSDKPTLCYFLLLLATINLRCGHLYLQLLHLNFPENNQVNFKDLFLIPVCAVIIIKTTRRNFKYIGLLQFIAFAIPALHIAVLLYFKHHILNDLNLVFGFIFFGLSLVALLLKRSVFTFETLYPIGKLSYAFYLFHFPVGYFMSRWFEKFLSGPILFWIGLLCWVIVSYAVSYVTEILMQPVIRKTLLKKQTPLKDA